MKILSDEEKNAHWNAVLYEGAKGFGIGLVGSFLLVQGVKRRYPLRFSQFNPSIKTAMWIMPTISLAAFFADQGSVKFDETRYRSDYIQQVQDEQIKKWDNLSLSEKLLLKLDENKYKIIITTWAASLYGSWHIINRDKYMTTAQKAVQARVIAQAITVVLLLGTILLSVHESEMKKLEPAEVPEWKKFLEEEQQRKKHAEKQQ
ncbi:uncharacterized protein PRCAT00000819001 [Priceomyces carsonii]|uniref:uncharacterized protein n=1 Tax=Priceomyces carsonii TaxID=28549 RepID=UPI002ED98014|nr:unnamed protein product [Priceomyces carsonii]